MNNRQNGRRRGRGGNGGNGQRGGNPGGPNSGNRIDNRARGNANQLYEKYKNLARDAQMSGDRVNTEYYLQFADHYFRVLSESRARFEEQNPNAPKQRRIQPVDSFDDYGDEDDFAEEGEPIRAGEQNGAQGGGRQDGGDGPQRDNQQRDGQQRDNQQRDGQQREPRRDEYRRDAQGGQRDGNRRFEGDRDGYRQERGERYAVTGSPVANDLGEDSPDGAEPVPIAPRRRGRPRNDDAAETNGRANGDAPAALDADRLPPSLSLANDPVEGDEGEQVAKPRRRRARAAGAEPPSAG